MDSPEKPITHITKVEIEKLWGLDDWNLSWELNPDVNILAGDNGSGKSTVLRFIFNLLNRTYSYLEKKSSQGSAMKLSFDKDRIKWEYTVSYGILYQTSTLGSLTTYEGDISHSSIEELTYFIASFDQKLKPLEAIQKLAGTGVETELDFEIYQLQDEYKDYQIQIGKRAIKALQKGSKDIESINGKLNLFWDTIDELFGKTGKHIEREKESLSFLLGKDRVLTPYDLSAGEKQMLLILLTALVQDNQPAIMLLDEPEVSLHTDWQEAMIDNIRKLNKNVQLIIATHSPFLLTNGWANKKYVFQIEKLKKETLTNG